MTISVTKFFFGSIILAAAGCLLARCLHPSNSSGPDPVLGIWQASETPDMIFTFYEKVHAGY